MDYYYYPGCSLKGIGISYEKSLLATFKALGISISELPDWNCCGATSYMAVDELSAFAMAARNIGIAEKDGKDILAPCSACYAILNKTYKYSREYPEMKTKLREALHKVGLPFDEHKQRIQHPLYMLLDEYGIDKIEAKLVHKLKGYTVFPYYGCLTSRPFPIEKHSIYPYGMDKLMETIGCDVVDHSLKTRCCGGTLTGTIPSVGLRMVYILLAEAKRLKADVIVTMCPLCQFNLDVYQKKAEEKYKTKFRIPILYFTQLLGLALGVDPEDLGLKHHVISFKKTESV